VVALLAAALALGLLFGVRAMWLALVYASSAEATVEAETMTVAAPADAAIAELAVRIGDRVKRGQLLARLDREMLAAAARQAQADLAAREADFQRAETQLEAARRDVDVEGKKAQAAVESAQASVALAKAESTRVALSSPERVRQAKAELEQAKAQLDLADRNRPELVAEARAGVAEAEAVAQRADKEYVRQTHLREQGYTSVGELEAARAEVDISNARLTAAQERLKRVETGSQEELIRAARQQVAAMDAALRLAVAGQYATASSKHEVTLREADVRRTQADLEGAAGLTSAVRMRQDDVTVAQAQVERARAALAAAQKALTEVEIRSPVAGIIIAKPVHEGELAARGATTLFVIIDKSRPYWVKALFSEHQVARIRPGQSAMVTLNADDRVLRGRVVAVGDVAASRNPTSADASGRSRPAGSAAQVAVVISLQGARGQSTQGQSPLIPGLSARVAVRVRCAAQG
jgi:multidrug resistance efflux pump